MHRKRLAWLATAPLLVVAELDAWSDALYIIDKRGWPKCFQACVVGVEAPNDMWSCGGYRNYGGCLCQAFEFLEGIHDCIYHDAECKPADLNTTAQRFRDKCFSFGVQITLEADEEIDWRALRPDAIAPVSRVSSTSGKHSHPQGHPYDPAYVPEANVTHGGRLTTNEGDSTGHGESRSVNATIAAAALQHHKAKMARRRIL